VGAGGVLVDVVRAHGTVLVPLGHRPHHILHRRHGDDVEVRDVHTASGVLNPGNPTGKQGWQSADVAHAGMCSCMRAHV
jgi:hypothetical protein